MKIPIVQALQCVALKAVYPWNVSTISIVQALRFAEPIPACRWNALRMVIAGTEKRASKTPVSTPAAVAMMLTARRVKSASDRTACQGAEMTQAAMAVRSVKATAVIRAVVVTILVNAEKSAFRTAVQRGAVGTLVVPPTNVAMTQTNVSMYRGSV